MWTVWIPEKKKNIWDIRKHVPEWYFRIRTTRSSARVVEEDVGFGPENMGVPTEEIWERVEGEPESCAACGNTARHSPNKLSGGQKQRVAIAGVVAMHPKCIVSG